jgi:ABC-type Fe3+ transport system permease subunit
MKKNKTGLTGCGIFIVIAAVVVMVIVRYNKSSEEQVLLRIVFGLLACGASFFGAGLIYLVLFVAMYGAIKLSEEIFTDKPGRNLMDAFQELSNPILIICLAVSYVACLLLQ